MKDIWHSQAREEQLNSLVDHLTVQQAGDPSSGMLDPKVPLPPIGILSMQGVLC